LTRQRAGKLDVPLARIRAGKAFAFTFSGRQSGHEYASATTRIAFTPGK
jgi:hypothetical protein